MSWNDLASNPRVILGYYSAPPALDAVEVHSLALHRDGPTLEMVAELPAFADRPSLRGFLVSTGQLLVSLPPA